MASHPSGHLGSTGFWPLSYPFSWALSQGSKTKPQFRRKLPQLSAHKQPGAQFCIFMTAMCVLQRCPVSSTVPLNCAAGGHLPQGPYVKGGMRPPQTQVLAAPRWQRPGETTCTGHHVPGDMAGSGRELEMVSFAASCAGNMGWETGPALPGCKRGATVRLLCSTGAR